MKIETELNKVANSLVKLETFGGKATQLRLYRPASEEITARCKALEKAGKRVLQENPHYVDVEGRPIDKCGEINSISKAWKNGDIARVSTGITIDQNGVNTSFLLLLLLKPIYRLHVTRLNHLFIKLT